MTRHLPPHLISLQFSHLSLPYLTPPPQVKSTAEKKGGYVGKKAAQKIQAEKRVIARPEAADVDII